jgi:hypothetical protein
MSAEVDLECGQADLQQQLLQMQTSAAAATSPSGAPAVSMQQVPQEACPTQRQRP